MKRRLFLLAAPAIVAAPSLMRVSAAALPQDPIIQHTRFPWKEIRVGCMTIHWDNVVADGDKVYFVDAQRYLYLRDGQELTWDQAKALFPPSTPITLDVSRRVS